MNMVGGAYMGNMTSQQPYQQMQQTQPAPSVTWRCNCGNENSGKFCSECGSPRPSSEWICRCGTKNKGRFCSECGSPRQ